MVKITLDKRSRGSGEVAVYWRQAVAKAKADFFKLIDSSRTTAGRST